jgi:hypothetical protein
MSLDQSYDYLFEGRTTLPWWPWVGSGFSASVIKTMIVGESVYKWHPEIEAFNRRYAKVDGLRITHKNHALKFDRNSKYVRNIERAIFLSGKPSSEQKLRLWSSVVYHNLVLEPLATNRHRPKEQQYRDGWAELLDLTALLGVEQCLVYGLEATKLQALKDVARNRNLLCEIGGVGEKIGRSRPQLAVVTTGDKPLKLLFVRHPSTFFSWRGWAPVIREHLHL